MTQESYIEKNVETLLSLILVLHLLITAKIYKYCFCFTSEVKGVKSLSETLKNNFEKKWDYMLPYCSVNFYYLFQLPLAFVWPSAQTRDARVLVSPTLESTIIKPKVRMNNLGLFWPLKWYFFYNILSPHWMCKWDMKNNPAWLFNWKKLKILW